MASNSSLAFSTRCSSCTVTHHGIKKYNTTMSNTNATSSNDTRLLLTNGIRSHRDVTLSWTECKLQWQNVWRKFARRWIGNIWQIFQGKLTEGMSGKRPGGKCQRVEIMCEGNKWVAWWRYRYVIGFAIYRSLVRVLPQHHCSVALGKLLTPVCLCDQAVKLGTSQRAVKLWGWERWP